MLDYLTVNLSKNRTSGRILNLHSVETYISKKIRVKSFRRWGKDKIMISFLYIFPYIQNFQNTTFPVVILINRNPFGLLKSLPQETITVFILQTLLFLLLRITTGNVIFLKKKNIHSVYIRNYIQYLSLIHHNSIQYSNQLFNYFIVSWDKVWRNHKI